MDGAQGITNSMSSPLKHILRRLADKVVSRNKLNDHYLYGLYLRVFYPNVVKRKSAEIAFYKRTLNFRGQGIIFDIGANVGDKTRLFRQIGATVVALEPNPATFGMLQTRFARESGVRTLNQAGGAIVSTADMAVFKTSHALSTLADKLSQSTREAIARGDEVMETRHVVVTTIDKLIEDFGMPYYVKIDVEGFELNVLKGLSVSIPFISFECNLPDFEQETIACVAALKALNDGCRFNYTLTEPPIRLEHEHWIDADDLVRIMTGERYSYLEIFARNP